MKKKILYLCILFGILIGLLGTFFPGILELKFWLSLIVFLITLFVLIIVYNVIFYKHLVKGAPYIPSSKTSVEAIISLINPQPNQKIADLGSGDGRLVLALGRTQAEVHGFEINPFLVIISIVRIRLSRVHKNAFIHFENFWNKDFSSFDVVIIYGIDYIMKDLEHKLMKELKPGSKVISNKFVFPNLKVDQEAGEVYLYHVGNLY